MSGIFGDQLTTNQRSVEYSYPDSQSIPLLRQRIKDLEAEVAALRRELLQTSRAFVLHSE